MAAVLIRSEFMRTITMAALLASYFTKLGRIEGPATL